MFFFQRWRKTAAEQGGCRKQLFPQSHTAESGYCSLYLPHALLAGMMTSAQVLLWGADRTVGRRTSHGAKASSLARPRPLGLDHLNWEMDFILQPAAPRMQFGGHSPFLASATWIWAGAGQDCLSLDMEKMGSETICQGVQHGKRQPLPCCSFPTLQTGSWCQDEFDFFSPGSVYDEFPGSSNLCSIEDQLHKEIFMTVFLSAWIFPKTARNLSQGCGTESVLCSKSITSINLWVRWRLRESGSF